MHCTVPFCTNHSEYLVTVTVSCCKCGSAIAAAVQQVSSQAITLDVA